jgi:hypothetical protein
MCSPDVDPGDDYEQIVVRLRAAVEAAVPAGATVAVAARGDDDLVQFPGRTGLHVPADESGAFAGGQPADGADAVHQIEAARQRGARYLLLPEPQRWWLDCYPEFRAWLAQHEQVWDDTAGTLYRLRQPPSADAATRLGMLARFHWRKDRAVLDDLVFRIEHGKADNWDLGDDCFRFYKVKDLVDEYAEFWATRGHVPVRNVLELGIWDGGSAAFWFEFFRPRKHVAVDFQVRQDSRYFVRYLQSRGLGERLKTLWGVDQADRPRLAGIADAEFDGPLDVVIDDASHLYGPTRASFETLFPRLRPGGLYFLEDWAWEYDPQFRAAGNPLAGDRGMAALVKELTDLAGSGRQLIRRMTVFNGFVAVERGHGPLPPREPFNVDYLIRRAPVPG